MASLDLMWVLNHNTSFKNVKCRCNHWHPFIQNMSVIYSVECKLLSLKQNIDCFCQKVSCQGERLIGSEVLQDFNAYKGYGGFWRSEILQERINSSEVNWIWWYVFKNLALWNRITKVRENNTNSRTHWYYLNISNVWN